MASGSAQVSVMKQCHHTDHVCHPTDHVCHPSLIISLMVTSLGGLTFPVSRLIHEQLGCDNIKMLISLEELQRNPYQWDLTRCSFTGVKVGNILVNWSSFTYLND